MNVELIMQCALVSVMLVCLITCVLSCIFAFLAYSKVVGLEKSTHKIQWVPMDQGLSGSDLAKKMYASEFDIDEDEHV